MEQSNDSSLSATYSRWRMEAERTTAMSAGISSLATASRRAIEEHRAMTQDEVMETMNATKSLRQGYEEIFNEQELYHSAEQEWWKGQFDNVAKELTHLLIKEFPPCNENYSNELSVAWNHQLYQFKDKQVILVGRHIGCDVLFNINGTSRLHTMVFPLPQFGKILVVDVGSLSGVETLKRSSEQPLRHSRPTNREVLILDWNEVAVFKLGDTQICINPRECVICFDRPRHVTFNCKHFLVCVDCASKITLCPLCRTSITNQDAGYAMKTCIS